MSRSIHTTRKSLSSIRRKKFASVEERETAIAEVEDELDRKRLIKKMVGIERHNNVPAAARTNADTISILTTDSGTYVHHAVTPDDLRSVLRRLPAEATNGIGEIRLTLGFHYMKDRGKKYGGKPDPFTGRLGVCIFPGVYSGTVLGSYHQTPGRITINAYVIDQGSLTIPLSIAQFYLRLQALKTFVHEVAHFHDHTARVKRGRWLADRKENFEWYAEKMEHQWTREIVLPYLTKVYPNDYRAIRAWIKQRGGIDMPLEFLAGDQRKTERNGMIKLVCSTNGAFENWLEALPRCQTREDGQLALAWELHYADKYEECLAILDEILIRRSAHAPTLACRADTLIHLEKLDEALKDADLAIRTSPTETIAWEARANVLESRKNWLGLIDTCMGWLGIRPANKKLSKNAHRGLAIAYCALGEVDRMHSSIGDYWKAAPIKDPVRAERRANFLMHIIHRRAGKPWPDDPIAKKERASAR